MNRIRSLAVGAAVCFLISLPVVVLSQEPTSRVNPQSPWGLDFYAQGGVVVDGIAYFTASDYSRRKGVKRTAGFPHVVAFDTETFKKIRSYDFDFTYDSSPLVVQKRDGTWLVIAHEYKKQRTVARNRDSGVIEWIGEANQPGNYFFGYSYYRRDDGSELLLMACNNGLHALSSEDGREVWWVKRRSTGGVTPCVDQKNGFVFYQSNGRVLKLRAVDGSVLKETVVPEPHRCISWNTVLIDDEYGYHVATRWYGKPEWDSAIRVYDRDLNLRWERTGLPNGKKDTLTYFEGKLICGSGNGWSTKYTGDEWKYIAAYSISDGTVDWKCDLSKYDYRSILNLPCLGGYLYGENGGSPPQTTKCFRINATTGKLEEVYRYGRTITSCATHIIARGKIFSGDLWEDAIVVTRIATGSTADWPGPFGDAQTHQMTAPHQPAALLTPITEIGREERIESDKADRVRSTEGETAKGEIGRGGDKEKPQSESSPRASSSPASLSSSSSADGAIKPASVFAQSRIRGEQGDAGRIIDGDEHTWWSSGPGHLVYQPRDVDVTLEEEQVIGGLVIITRSIKNQVRLKDFDVYAGLDGAWDGTHPLARVRNNTGRVIRVPLPPVEVDCLRLRLLGTGRPDNAFAHIAELSVHRSQSQPTFKVEPSSFPPSLLVDVDHDPCKLRNAISLLSTSDDDPWLTHSLIEAMQERLRLIEESRPYERKLARISADTERYRTLGAPEWALAERDCMARLRNWAYYWIDHQQPDGQFGGGYEDDVELTCGWPVLVLGQDDARVLRSLELLAEGVWKSSPYLEQFGYDRLTDVEHASEKTGYSQPPMVVLDNEHPQWAKRCRLTVSTMADFFLSRNQRGFLQFRSSHFGIDPDTLKPVTLQQQYPFDIPHASKALKAALYAVWWGGDEQSKALMLDYGRTWVEAARNTDGLHRIDGLLPVKIDWPSGAVSGTHAHLASMRATLFHLIGCYYVSGDRQYLEPIRALLAKCVIDWSVGDIPSAGTLDEVRSEDLTSLLDQLALVAVLYRQASGDNRFDDALARWAHRIRDSLLDGVKSYVLLDRRSEGVWHVDRPLKVGAYLESRCAVGCQLFLGWEVTGDGDYLARIGWNLSSCLNDKWGAFTYWFYDKSEGRVSSNDHPAHKLQQSESALSLMYLGSPAPVESVWPRIAVTWKDGGENFCALVRHNSSRRFQAQVYCFDERTQSITARLWELAPGSYEVVMGADANNDGRPDSSARHEAVVVSAHGPVRTPTIVRFSLPGRALMAIDIHGR